MSYNDKLVLDGELGTALDVNPYADIIAKLRAIPDDADSADLRKLAAEIRTQVPESSNPKDRIGQAKVSISSIPATALLHEARAMMNGKMKYGPYNWREHTVSATVYIDAAWRHLMCWQEREEEADDSQVHHLGHLCACAAILMDAQATNSLIDDRPQGHGEFLKLLKELNVKGLYA